MSIGNGQLYHYSRTVLYNTIQYIYCRVTIAVYPIPAPTVADDLHSNYPSHQKKKKSPCSITLSHFFHNTHYFCSLRLPDSVLGASLGYCLYRNRKQGNQRKQQSKGGLFHPQDPAASSIQRVQARCAHPPKRAILGTPHPAICYCLLKGLVVKGSSISFRSTPRGPPPRARTL